MGNVALCAPSMLSTNEIKILSTDGTLEIHTRSRIKAADIMLENPGQFLCESRHLKVGQRIPGVCAEEQLQKGRVYFLLPMEMLYSVLTHEELKFVTHKTSKGMKQFSKIFPEIFCIYPSGCEEFEAAVSGFEEVERYSRQRSWQPALETIVENT